MFHQAGELEQKALDRESIHIGNDTHTPAKFYKVLETFGKGPIVMVFKAVDIVKSSF